MDYEKVKELSNGVVLFGVRNFGLKETLDNGSTFRWTIRNNIAEGIVRNKPIFLKYYDETTLLIANITLKEFYDFYENYFDLKTEYQPIIDFILDNNKELTTLIPRNTKLRLVKQDYLESIISAMISQNNNINRIKQIINRLCYYHGSKVEYKNKTYHLFPTLEQLIEMNIDDFNKLGCGYRSQGLVEVITILNNIVEYAGSLSNYYNKFNHEELVNRLMKYRQVGNKVANFIITMTGSCKDFNKSFVIDTWIIKAMQDIFNVYPSNSKEFSLWLNNHFGDYQAIAQQNIFYYYRNKNLIKGRE